MTEKKAPRTGITPSDMDTQGNVTLWDHGPRKIREIPHETEEAKKERTRLHEEDTKRWHEDHGDEPVALVMHSSDASHAMMIEPERYALEPLNLDEAEIEKRVKEKRERREAARDFAQNAIDRREAIAEMMSDRENKRVVEKEPKGDAPQGAPRRPFEPFITPSPEPIRT